MLTFRSSDLHSEQLHVHVHVSLESNLILGYLHYVPIPNADHLFCREQQLCFGMLGEHGEVQADNDCIMEK